MSFMQKQVTREMRWLKVETSQGTEFLSVFDTGLDWPNSDSLPSEKVVECCTDIAQYCEGEPGSWENIKGYGARSSAPGYLDCTEWTVFDTAEDAQKYLDDTYEDDEETEA